MRNKCEECRQVFCYCWRETKYQLPPLGEVIEGLTPKNHIYSDLGRDYFCLVDTGTEVIWLTPSLMDMDFKELQIKYWRYIPPDPKGKKPFIKIKKRNSFFEPKVYFKKEEYFE